MTKKTDASPAALPAWQLRNRILTYLGVPKGCDAQTPVKAPLDELGEFYVAVGNLLRALTPIIEAPDEAPPAGRSDTLRELWPWYRERGLAVMDQARTTRPMEDPALAAFTAKVDEALSRILAITKGGAK